MVKYSDGGTFTPKEFPSDYGFHKSSTPPNVNRVQAKSIATGAKSTPRDATLSSGKGHGYPVKQREPMAKGGAVLSAEAYGLKNGSIATDQNPDKAAQPKMTGPRMRRAMGGTIPGPAPAAGASPLTRQPTPNPMPRGNPLARAQVSMPASDLGSLTTGAAKAGAMHAVNTLAQVGQRAGRIAPHAALGPGIMASPTAAAPPMTPQQGIPQGGLQMAKGGRVKRAMGGPMMAPGMQGQMPPQMGQQMPQQMGQQMPGQMRPPVQTNVNMPMPMAKGGHLRAATRNKMPNSEFALPGKGEGKNGKGSGAYPVNDAKHARLALAMDHNASPTERKTIERKVHARYPNIGKG